MALNQFINPGQSDFIPNEGRKTNPLESGGSLCDVDRQNSEHDVSNQNTDPQIFRSDLKNQNTHAQHYLSDAVYYHVERKSQNTDAHIYLSDLLCHRVDELYQGSDVHILLLDRLHQHVADQNQQFVDKCWTQGGHIYVFAVRRQRVGVSNRKFDTDLHQFGD